MNSKGLFSLVLVLFFIVLSLKTAQMQKDFSTQTKEAAKFLIEMEKTSFIRSELETNFDFLVKHSIAFWAKESLDSEFLEKHVNEDIARLVSGTERIYPKTIHFFLFKKHTGEEQEFSKEKMKELFNIQVKPIENFYEAEFSFNGGTEKDTFFGSTIELDSFSQNFFVTPGYSIKVLGMAPG